MAELPLAQGIDRFKKNEDRMDQFTNGSDTQSFTTSGGQSVPSIRKFLKDKDTEVNTATGSILSQTIAARDAAVSAKLGSEGARDQTTHLYDSTLILHAQAQAFRDQAKDFRDEAEVFAEESITEAELMQTLQKNGILTPQQFGAMGDGTTDDTTALRQAMEHASFSKKTLYIPSGNYLITAAINIVSNGGFSMHGSSDGNTKIVYGGSANNVDILTIGNSSEVKDFRIRDLTFESNTDMASGYALVFRNCSRVRMYDVNFDHIGGARRLFNGVWFNDLQQGWFIGGELYVKGTGLTVNGRASDQHGADLWCSRTFAVSCNVAYHIAGGFGGFYIDDGGGFGNGKTVLLDNGKVANGNRELFFGMKFVSDGAFEAGIHFNDPTSNNSPVLISGFVGSSGTFGGTFRQGIRIEKWLAGRINIDNAHVFNMKGDAIVVLDFTTLVNIGSGTFIDHNDGHAIFCPIPNGNINSYAYVAVNRRTSDNVNYSGVGGDGVWIAGGSINARPGAGAFGSMTSSLRRRKDRNKCSFTCIITVTDLGSGSNDIYFALPFVPFGSYSFAGQNINTKQAVTAYTQTGSDVRVSKYDGTFPLASGHTIVISGTYEML